VNRRIVRLLWVAIGLVTALITMTLYWQTWAAPGLAARGDNAVKLVAEFGIDRGRIAITRPPRLLARNREEVVDGRTIYFRRYPQGRTTAHVVGYSTLARTRTGLERSLNDYLTGATGDLSSLVDRALDDVSGDAIVGDDVVLTLDLAAQRTALEELGRTCGAVVALDPRTG
jgi:peptidoglycan glycosyltransferase